MSSPATAVSSTKPTTESYQVVARRYRPQGFDHLVGQDHVARALSNAITTHRIGHAYLFTGARGVGKTSTARIFAKALNCENGPSPSPCNECEACSNISVGEDVDVLEIDGASNRGIDEIRQLRQNASIKPSRSRYKIYIIDEVHMLTREAFNALLKTLEEPPEHVKFIFCTTEAAKIPITILSRCQRFDFAGIEMGAIAGRLQEIAEKEGVTAESGVFETLARRAAGSMRDGQSLLEQLLSFAAKHLTVADVNQMLGTADDQRLFQLVESIHQGQLAALFAELDVATHEGVDVGVLLEQVMGVFRDLMAAAAGAPAAAMLYTAPGRFDQVRHFAGCFGLPRILASLQVLDQTYTKMRYSTYGRTLLELALVRLASLDQLQLIAVLLEQIRGGSLKNVSLPPQYQPPPLPPPQSSPPQRSSSGGSSGHPNSLSVSGATGNGERIVSSSLSSQPQSVSISQTGTTGHSDGVPSTFPSAMKTPISPPLQYSSISSVLSETEAVSVWKEVVSRLPMMIAGYAEQFSAIRVTANGGIQVEFGSAFSKSLCDKEFVQIHQLLQTYLGRKVSLTFVVKPAAEKPTGTGATGTVSGTGGRPPQLPPTQNRHQRMSEVSQSPFVALAEQLFKATLVDIQ